MDAFFGLLCHFFFCVLSGSVVNPVMSQWEVLNEEVEVDKLSLDFLCFVFDLQA